MKAIRLLSLAFSLLLVSSLFAAPRKKNAIPDFTKGDKIPAGAKHDWNLGATGMRGWMYSDRLVTTDARQIYITKVAKGAPADGVLAVGDVILGVAGKRFSHDPRTEFGRALTAAESDAGGGTLSLIRWRKGTTETVVVTLPVLGTYSDTAPYDCPKSKRILEQGCRAIEKRISSGDYRLNAIPRCLNALALLASGDTSYLPLVKKEAQWAAGFSAKGMATWYYGYVMIFLSEYAMQTGDESVMPGLTRLAKEAVRGQSIVGSWGHRFAGPDGRLLGYGMMNQPGLTLTLGLTLAREAGIQGLDRAIERSVFLLQFYIGKGSIPYGDHHPWIQTHEDNGKNGSGATLFNLLGNKKGAEFFSRMCTASHGAERDCGHTGNFFNMLWALPGVAQSGRHATGQWMKEFGARFLDLARCPDGSFVHLGAPTTRGDTYRNWDCTGAFLLAYAMPTGVLRMTREKVRCAPQIDAATAKGLIADGRGWSNKDRNGFYDKLTTKQLIDRLGSWSPIVRQRAAMALGRRKENITDVLCGLLDTKELYKSYGACQALKLQRGRAAGALDALLRAFRSDDLWLRILAADALAGIGKPAMKAVPEMLDRMTRHDIENDPRNMEQRYLCFALFNRRGGLLSKSVKGVDRDLLFRAVRAGLLNQDGRARGCLGNVYRLLSFEELKPLHPDILKAITVPAPSGIMFADGIQNSGLELLSKNRVAEGMPLIADYSWKQKPHGSEKRINRIMDLLKPYGAHAKSVIPKLERAVQYFENEEKDFPRRLSLEKARAVKKAIKEIEASTDKPELIHPGT